MGKIKEKNPKKPTFEMVTATNIKRKIRSIIYTVKVMKRSKKC